MENNNLKFCPVCGFPSEENDQFIRFGETCPCCAFEFGIDDTDYGDNAFMKYRLKWFKNGMEFMSSTEFKNWDLKQVITNLNNLSKVKLSDYFLYDKVNNSEWTSNYNLEEIKGYWENAR